MAVTEEQPLHRVQGRTIAIGGFYCQLAVTFFIILAGFGRMGYDRRGSN